MLLPAPMTAHHPVLPSTAAIRSNTSIASAVGVSKPPRTAGSTHPVDAAVTQRVDYLVREAAAVADVIHVLAHEGERGIDCMRHVDRFSDHGFTVRTTAPRGLERTSPAGTTPLLNGSRGLSPRVTSYSSGVAHKAMPRARERVPAEHARSPRIPLRPDPRLRPLLTHDYGGFDEDSSPHGDFVDPRQRDDAADHQSGGLAVAAAGARQRPGRHLHTYRGARGHPPICEAILAPLGAYKRARVGRSRRSADLARRLSRTSSAPRPAGSASSVQSAPRPGRSAPDCSTTFLLDRGARTDRSRRQK